jgi:hypothetical protein
MLQTISSYIAIGIENVPIFIKAGMIAGLVAVFFYQVAYGVQSGGYPIARYDKCAYQTGFQAGKQDGLNSVADVGDSYNDGTYTCS